MKRLGDAEYEIMEALWAAEEPVMVNYIVDNLKQRSSWPTSTVMTVLSRLEKGGFVQCDRTTRRNLYTPIVEKDDYKISQCKNMLKDFYDDSIVKMIEIMINEGKISKEEIKGIRKLLDDVGGTEK
jgi:BlaI family penicillinase repressor